MATASEELLLQEYIKAAERASIPREDFAWPDAPGGPKYPCDTQDHVDSCAKLLGHAPEDKQASIKACAIRIAKRHGFSIPDSWKDGKTEESTATIARPAKKIATLPICFLEYNARSLNGRIYPKATCDAIFQAALKKIAEADATDPPTTFVSHEDANHNVNTHLIGGPTKVWQDGNKFWANIDVADTSVARDMVALIEGRYLRSGSIRVLGVELRQDRNYDLPLVVVQDGAEPVFQGIDLTTRPGLVDTARIPQVLYEEANQPPYIESFNFEILPIQKEASMSGIPMYAQIALGMLQEAMTPDREAHQRIHGHLAGVLDETVKAMHGSESAAFRAGIVLSEEGRALAQKHATRLAAAHDESARTMGMTCEGAYNEALGIASSDTDQDGDDPAAGNDSDNDGESAKGDQVMTEAEMLAALQAKGYTVAPPKTELQLLKEQLEEQARQIEALRQQGTPPPPQRQTQAPSSLSETTYQPETMYETGDYLKGPIAPDHWKALTDRRVPWPKDVDPRTAIHELAPVLAYRLMTQEAVADSRGRAIVGLRGLDERF